MSYLDARFEGLKSWLGQLLVFRGITAIPGDASVRRYFRIECPEGTYIAVDSPIGEDSNKAFVYLSRALSWNGLKVPEVLGACFERGYLLLSDLGDTQLLGVLNRKTVDQYYSQALKNLLCLSQCTPTQEWTLPLFNHALLRAELNLFEEWYLPKHLGLEISPSEQNKLSQLYELLIGSANNQPQVFVHRDYHSRNLMLLPNNELGILDFQDAVMGPITYDLVSLLKDCYINWPLEQIDSWVKQYWELLSHEHRRMASYEQFQQWFDWMGVQRHLKVLGIFARLFHRDGKPNYLRDIPRIIGYIMQVYERYPELSALKNFFIQRVIPHESHDSRSGTWEPNAATHE